MKKNNSFLFEYIVDKRRCLILKNLIFNKLSSEKEIDLSLNSTCSFSILQLLFKNLNVEKLFFILKKIQPFHQKIINRFIYLVTNKFQICSNHIVVIVFNFNNDNYREVKYVGYKNGK